MKRLTRLFWISASLFIGAIASASTGCLYADGVRGDGNVVKEERSVSDFTKLDVSGAFTVYITQGNKEELVVEADKNLMDMIETRVSGSTLKISTEGSIRDFDELNIYLTYKSLEEIEISGAVELTTENRMKTKDLELDVSGAAELDMSIEAELIYADFSGASDVEFAGYTKEMNVDVSGAAKLDALELETETVKIDVSGSADAKVYVKEKLYADVSGAANLRYKGDPKVNSDISGAGSLKPY